MKVLFACAHEPLILHVSLTLRVLESLYLSPSWRNRLQGYHFLIGFCDVSDKIVHFL
jgi:hypothetical protein